MATNTSGSLVAVIELFLSTLGAFPTVPFLAHPHHDILKVFLAPCAKDI